jgi:allantoin racemase
MAALSVEPLRIANMLPPSFGDSYAVPAAAVALGFSSEIFPLSAEISFVNDLDRAITGLIYVEAGIRAQSAGYAAVFINSVGDYGIRELRAALSIPVVGAGQASFQAAGGLADQFGVLTVWPKVTGAMYARLISDYGFAGQCVGVRHIAENEELADMGEENGLVSEMRDLRTAALDRLERGGHDLLQQGADVIVLGCTCMSPVADELSRRLDCPVINPLTTAHKSAEMLLALGLTHPVAPVSSALHGLLPSLIGKPTSRLMDVDEVLCGDTCSILGSPAAKSS